MSGLTQHITLTTHTPALKGERQTETDRDRQRDGEREREREKKKNRERYIVLEPERFLVSVFLYSTGYRFGLFWGRICSLLTCLDLTKGRL